MSITTIPVGWHEASDGTLSCPHRDLSVCTECAARPEAVEVAGAYFWIPDPADREALAAIAEIPSPPCQQHTPRRYERKTTDQLQVGDVIRNYSMRLRVVEPIQETGTANEYGPCYRTPAVCINMDEVRADAERMGDWFIPNHMEGPDRDVWSIQGNRLATWSVEATV